LIHNRQTTTTTRSSLFQTTGEKKLPNKKQTCKLKLPDLAVGALGAKEEVGVIHKKRVVHRQRQLDVAQMARALFRA